MFVGKSQDELREITMRQLEKTETQREELERRQWCLKAAAEAALMSQHQGQGMILDVIRELTVQSEHFTPEERKIIQARNALIGRERIREMHAKLAELTKTAQEYIDQGLQPTDPKVVSLANEWQALGREGVGDDPQLRSRVRSMLRQNPDLSSYRGITPALLEFLRTAHRSQHAGEQ